MDKPDACPGRHPDHHAVQRQVAALADVLPGFRIGTVDKFQDRKRRLDLFDGHELAADAPRGMEFLYSRNRLNVATSRARCVAAVVASPHILRARCRTLGQMRLANALARLVECAST